LGHAAFSELAIDEKKGRNAEWGRRNGLYAELYSAPDTMEEGLFRLLKFLSLNNSEAMAGMKKVLWNDAENWDSELPRIALECGKQLWASLRQP
jgi:methylglutaconyl-CoA hydratase